MSRNKVAEKPGELTARLSQLADLDRPRLVAPRQSTEVIEPAQEQPLNDVVVHQGQMYVLSGAAGPRLEAATWLRPARRPVR